MWTGSLFPVSYTHLDVYKRQLLKGVKFPDKCRPLSEKCKKCGACLRPGCPALTKNEDGTISIDETMCNGCGLCKQLCKFDAIETVKAGE